MVSCSYGKKYVCETGATIKTCIIHKKDNFNGQVNDSALVENDQNCNDMIKWEKIDVK